MPTYTANWFGKNAKVWKPMLSFFKDKPGLRFLEIGCFEGRATIWLLENILTHHTSSIETIDTFKGSMEHKDKEKDFFETAKKNYYENIKPYGTKVITHEGLSGEVLRSLPLNTYDFVYIDGSHTAPDVLEDTILAWRLLKSGGLILWDDYEWEKYADPIYAPKIAIDAFLGIFRGRYSIVYRERQLSAYKLK